MTKVEFIESYIKEGNDYIWNDNHGELIRCKDCKWRSKENDSLQGRCALLQMYPTREWFCANGERKEE